MALSPLADVLAYLRKTCAIQAARDVSDGQLLARFATARDEAAFGALVHRHGPMVLGVCQRLLGDIHLAEDAFQAVFLVLVRRAASLGRSKPVGGWLYAVAHRIAAKARAPCECPIPLREIIRWLLPFMIPQGIAILVHHRH